MDIHEKIKKIEIQAKQSVLDLFSGMYRSRFKGKGIEVEDLREYQPGDDVRSISWSRTAHMGKPYIKNFREERDLTVVLLVDISASLFFGSHFEMKRERMAEVAALLAFSAIYNNDRVGLILFSSEVEKYIPPKRGLKHGVRLIRELLSFEPKKKSTNMKAALHFLNQVTHKRCITFLLSDFQAEGYAREFVLTAKKNDLVGIRIYDPEEKQLSPIGLVHLRDPETEESSLVDITEAVSKEYSEKQKAFLVALQTIVGKSGASLLEIETRGSYEAILRTFFGARREV